MIEYIYFVKCPNCEDEHFYFFNDAKDCAMSQLSKKPIITQTEVNRNDFGECTDSCDLGTIWSWEDMMKDVPADPEQTTFSKADTVECDNCFDQEFDELDNSVEPAEVRKPVLADMSIEDLVEAMEENEDDVECKFCNELFDKSECEYDKDYGWLCSGCQRAISEHGGQLVLSDEPLTEAPKYKDSVEFHYDSLTVEITTKVIPATRWDPEEYEEEEYTDDFDFEVDTDTVEDVLWNNFLTEEDAADVPGGLDALEDEDTWRAFLDTHFDALLEKYNDKFLEYFRAAAEEEAREVFQERYAELHSEGPDPDRAYDEWRDSQYFEESCPRRTMSEAMDPREMVELEYPELTVTLYGPKRAEDDWDEVEHTDSHVFLVPKVEVATAIWENWITEEDVADVEGGLEALEDDKAWEKFLETHFDDLFEKYNKEVLKHFEDEATKDFRERSQEDYSLGQWKYNSDRAYDELMDDKYFNESRQKPFLEEFDDAETHKANLTDCPECGTVSYDMKEQYCINCGLGL